MDSRTAADGLIWAIESRHVILKDRIVMIMIMIIMHGEATGISNSVSPLRVVPRDAVRQQLSLVARGAAAPATNDTAQQQQTITY